MRCGPSVAGESPGICSEFSISGAPGRDCERFVRNTCPWGTRAASAHALKGYLELNNEAYIIFPIPLNCLEWVRREVWEWHEFG